MRKHTLVLLAGLALLAGDAVAASRQMNSQSGERKLQLTASDANRASLDPMWRPVDLNAIRTGRTYSEASDKMRAAFEEALREYGLTLESRSPLDAARDFFANLDKISETHYDAINKAFTERKIPEDMDSDAATLTMLKIRFNTPDLADLKRKMENIALDAQEQKVEEATTDKKTTDWSETDTEETPVDDIEQRLRQLQGQ